MVEKRQYRAPRLRRRERLARIAEGVDPTITELPAKKTGG